MEMYGVSCKKYAENENLNVKKIKENRLIFEQIVLFMARENWILLKTKKDTFSIIFEIINLK